MAGRRKPSSKHGPVRHITDPKELARLGKKYLERVPGGHEAVPCNGNRILFKIDAGAERIVTDHDIVELLKADAENPEGRKLSRKNRKALADFRRKLSKEGAGSFSPAEKSYLKSLVRMVESSERYRIPEEERVRRRTRVKAFYKARKLWGSRTPPPKHGEVTAEMKQIIKDFAGSDAVRNVMQEASEALGRYGLEDRAEDLVYRILVAKIGWLVDYEIEDSNIPAKELESHLFHRFFNPESHKGLDRTEGLDCFPVEELGWALEGIDMSDTEAVENALGYLVTQNLACSISPVCLQGGSPGSGRGGRRS